MIWPKNRRQTYVAYSERATVNVQDKQAALIHAKQRTPRKQPKPVTPSKSGPNLNHLMASRKLEKDLKKRISDLQVHCHPPLPLCSCMLLTSVPAAVNQDVYGHCGTLHAYACVALRYLFQFLCTELLQQALTFGAGGPGGIPCSHGRAEKERSSALGESVRRAQQARRDAEQERVRAASAADVVRQKVSGLTARVKALQRQLEEVHTLSISFAVLSAISVL